jgi:hypothetical protein
MQGTQWAVADVRHEVLKPMNIVTQTLFMAVLEHEFCCRFLKRSVGADPKEACLAKIL